MTQSTTNKSLRVATMGMDRQTQRLLEMVFNGPGRGDFLIADQPENADACIFDLDGIDASKLWANYRNQHPQLPTIILSITLQDVAGCLFVKKPIEIDKLLKSLNKIKQLKEEEVATGELPHLTVKSNAGHLSATQTTRTVKLTTEVAMEAEEEALHQFCGYNPDINPDRPEEVEKVYYEPTNYLQGFFEKAYSIGQQLDSGGILVEGLYTPMILSVERNQLLCGCDSSENQLRTMTLLPLSKSSHLRMTTLSETEIQQRLATDKLVSQPLESFLWKLALWTSRGKVPKGTDLQKNVVLLNWPNFTRLIVTPHAMEISALWIAQPLSIIETAKTLEIPQRYVFSFFSAACAIKLAFIDRRQGKRATMRTTSSSDQTKRGLFKRILARLLGQE